MDTRSSFDLLCSDLADAVANSGQTILPLDYALSRCYEGAGVRDQVVSTLTAGLPSDPLRGRILALCDVVAVAAAHAIRCVESGSVGGREFATDLVDLWGKAEAARSLWFESYVLWRSDRRAERLSALFETALQVAADSIGLALRFSSPCKQFIDFVTETSELCSPVKPGNATA